VKREEKARRIQDQLDELYPELVAPLRHEDPYTLLIAVLLSAQCTDVRVNQVTPTLFARASTPWEMLKLSVDEIREIIRPCGLSPSKSKAIAELSHVLVDDYDGQVPKTFEALEALRGLRPDVVFLDVQMPGRTGFEVLESLSEEERPAVVFTTAYDQYAVNAFDLHAVDYLLKPFDDERFDKALRRAKTQTQQQEAQRLSQKMLQLVEDHRATPNDGATPSAKSEPVYLDRMAVKSAGRVHFLKSSEIDWIEAADYYVKLHVGTKSHLMRESMNKLEKQLDPEMFLRVHRSSIVNLDRVKELHAGAGTDHAVVLQDGTRLKLSRSRRERLNRLLHGR